MNLRWWTGLAVIIAFTTTGKAQLTEVLPSKRTVKATSTRYAFDSRVFPEGSVAETSTAAEGKTSRATTESEDGDIQLNLPAKVGAPVEIYARVYELDPVTPAKNINEALEQIADGKARLVATPSLVTGDGNLATYESVVQLTHPETYDPPSVPKSIAGQTKPAELDINEGELVLPAFPKDFKTRDVGIRMHFRPIINGNGTITVRWDLENSALRGFSKNGDTITIEKKKAVGKKTRIVTLAENWQLKAEFLETKIKNTTEIFKESAEAATLVAPVVASETATPILHGAFATDLTQDGLAPLLVVLKAKKVAEPPAKAAPDNGLEKHIFLTIRAVEVTNEVAQEIDNGAFPMLPGAILTDPQFQVTIRALNQKKGVDLLTAPSVMMRNAEQAKVEVIREFVYPTEYGPPVVKEAEDRGEKPDGGEAQYFPVTPANPVKFHSKKTGVQFFVKARVAKDNQVEMQIRPSTTEFAEFFNFGEPIFSWVKNGIGKDIPVVITENRIEMPVFKTRSVETSVRIPDGMTVCLGGIMSNEIQDLQDKVPVLGDLPLVGKAFRSDVELHLQKRVYFFMTPRLMDPAGVAIQKKAAEKEDKEPENEQP